MNDKAGAAAAAAAAWALAATWQNTHAVSLRETDFVSNCEDFCNFMEITKQY